MLKFAGIICAGLLFCILGDAAMKFSNDMYSTYQRQEETIINLRQELAQERKNSANKEEIYKTSVKTLRSQVDSLQGRVCLPYVNTNSRSKNEAVPVQVASTPTCDMSSIINDTFNRSGKCGVL